MSTQLTVRTSAAILPGDILVARQPSGDRMQHSLLKGFYLQDLLIEPAIGRVSGPGFETHLKPKAVEVLLYLARRPLELVTRDELLHAVWGENGGSSEALTQAISELRSCCKDHANRPSLIQTVPRRGYRLLQEPRPVDEPEPVVATGVFQPPEDGSFIGDLMRRGVVQAAAAYMVFSWLLIQVADAVTPTLNLPIWFPSLVTYAALCGFPILLILAWMLERSEGRWLLDRGRQSGRLLSGLERNYLSIIVAYGLAAVGALAYQFTVGFDLPRDDEPVAAEAETLLPVDPNSIAVLKFLNIGGNEVGEIFSQGLGEDILDRLARIPGLAVSSRGDSWSLPENASSDIVRRRLRVAYFLEGSVRVIGDELRVVVQLIESASGFHVLSRSFEAELTDHMDVQREITDLAVANLRVALPEGQDTRPLRAGDDPELDTYLLYQQGRIALDGPQTPASFQEAIGYFEQALEIDPEFSAAHAEICRAHVEYFESTHDPAGIESAESACAAAVNSNPNLDVVYTALGVLRASTSNTLAAEEAFNRALEINPRNVHAMQGLAVVYQQGLKFDDAERLLIRAIDLQPGNWRSISDLGLLYFSTGRYLEAAHEFKKVVFLDPDNWIGHGNLGSALMMTGQFADALDPLTESLRIHKDPQYLSNLGIIYYYLGQFDRAVEMHRQAIDMMPDASFLWVNLGDALRFSSQPTSAREAYESAIEKAGSILAVDPNDPISLLMQGWSLASIGEIEAARTSIETAMRLAPENPYAHYYDGLLKLDLDETTGALDALESAVDLGYPVAMLKADPLLAGLRSESRFGALIDRD